MLATKKQTELSLQEIYFSKRQKVLVDFSKISKSTERGRLLALTVNKNLECLGYTFSVADLEVLACYSENELIKLYNELIPVIKSAIGARVRYEPMYPNFPEQVINASYAELYINALVHYASSWVADLTNDPSFILMPRYVKENREKLDEQIKYKVISVGNEDDFKTVFTNLVSANTSISQSDKDIINWFVKTYQYNIKDLLPNTIPNKENLATLVSSLMVFNLERLANQHIKTVTDVLRVAVGISGGDVSLGTSSKFKKFTRRERKYFLSMIESCGGGVEDMFRRPEVWKRFGKYLHPNEYGKEYSQATRAFNQVFNGQKPSTYASKVEAMLNPQKKFNKGLFSGTSLSLNEKTPNLDIELLKSRPGDFARRLDKVLRAFPKSQGEIIAEFADVVDKVSTPVLLALDNHFLGRNYRLNRYFLPKGSDSDIYSMPQKLEEIKQSHCLKISDICCDALVARFSSLPSLGKVYIDQKLTFCPIPFAQRAASKSLRTVARGTRFKLPEGKDTIRMFTYWKQGPNERIDIDLSASMFGEKWNHCGDLSYWNLREYGAVHSGDIVSAPKGASEFIDIHIPSMVDIGVRYVTMGLYSFSGQAYRDMPQAFCGYMMREKVGSGEIYEPATVENKMDLTANKGYALPMIFDTVQRQVIWSDLSLKSPVGANARNQHNKGVIGCKYVMEHQRPSLYDLFLLHTLARGELVYSAEKADTVFSLNKGVTPYDFDIIASQYLK